jgi:TPR repeat protein
MANANWDEIDEREPDLGLARKASELSDAEDFQSAMPIWISLAERGSARSMLEIGVCYEYGYGVPADLKQAENWYKQALAAGSQYAMLKCAHFAASRQDFLDCNAILQPGIEVRWASAEFWQGWYRQKQCDSKKSYQSIFPLLNAAAKRGHPGARTILANFMVRGKFGMLLVPIGFFRVVQFVLAELPRHRPAEQDVATGH